jgi:hypothetical protein
VGCDICSRKRPFQRGLGHVISERLHDLRHGLEYRIPICPEMLSSVRRKIEWLSDLTHVGGAVKVSWAEMGASQDSLVEPTCGNERALRVRVQLGQDGNLGRESEAGSESSECESSTVCGPLASDSRKGESGVFGTLWVASSCSRVTLYIICHCQCLTFFSWFRMSEMSSIAIFHRHRPSAPAPIVYRATC